MAMPPPLLLLRRVLALLSRTRREAELRDEMEAHIQLRRTALVAEGMDPGAAETEARRLFGNATQLREQTREMWGFPAAESMLQDVKYGARMLWRAPLFTAVAVLSIAGGLAAGTTVFAFMNALLFRPLGVGDGQNLYRIFTSDRDGSGHQSSSYPDYQSFRDMSGVLAATCATEQVRATVLVQGVAALHPGEIVSPGCFEAFELRPAVGRYFSADQAAAAAPPPVVISHSLWTRRFASDPGVAGRMLQLNGMAVTVTGVAPVGFAGTSLDGGADFWAPVQLAPVLLPPGTIQDRRQRRFSIFARLREGVGPEQAGAALAVVAGRLRLLDSAAWTTAAGGTRRVTVIRETEARFLGSPASPLGIFASVVAAIAVIVAIACLNLATMLLARGASRTREISIRLAIGASRGRVLRLLATESLIIATLGAAAAIGTVAVGLRLFEAYRPAELPAFDIALDWRVLSFAIVVAMIAALMFGLAPARHTLRLALAEGLSSRLGTAGMRRLRLGAREALIVVQVAVSIALLLVSTLFVRAMASGSTRSPGFNGAGVSVVMTHLDAVADAELASVTARLLAAAGTVPDVGQVSLAGMVPMSGSAIEFEATVEKGPERRYAGNVISPGYFQTLEIPFRAGRDFDSHDREGGTRVAIVSETLARSVWGTPQALGRALVIQGNRVEVVGVVADTRYRTLSEPFLPLVYLPTAQTPGTRFIVHARVRNPAALLALDAALRAVDPRVAIEGAKPLRAWIDRAMAPERAAQWAGGILGVLQLVLAVMALWGLVAYAVERRTAEMGVRIALGATPSSLVRLTMRPAGWSILAGVAIGCVLGATVAKLAQATSVGLAPLDFAAVIPVAAAFTMVAMLSAWWPARRAGKMDPAASLRRE
jgi:putative ABC transport system permease protein